MKPLSLLVLLSTLVMGCSTTASSPESGNTIQTYFPLAVGNRWTHTYVNYSEAGDTISSGIATTSIDSSYTSGSRTIYVMTAGIVPSPLYYSGSKLMEVHPELPEDYELFEYPILANAPITVWDGDVPFGGHQIETVALISDAEPVTVPAGTFTTMHLRLYDVRTDKGMDTLATVDHYYAPHVGEVRRTQYRQRSTGTTSYTEYKSELLSYHVN